MRKVLTLPVSGSMCSRHSKKLEWAIRNFISENIGTYYDDEIKKGIISCYFRLDNEICVEQKVHIRKYDYVCYTTLSCHINPADKERVAKCIQIANAINLKIDYGHFEVNYKTGDILFKSCYEPEDVVSKRGMFKLLVHPRRVINKYGYCFLLLDKEKEG